MYRVRQEDLPFQGSSHRFVGADNGDVNVSVFRSVHSQVAVLDPTGIHTMKSNSYARAAGCGTSTGRNSKLAPGTYLSSKLERSTASSASETRHSCKWMFISARASSRRIWKVGSFSLEIQLRTTLQFC